MKLRKQIKNRVMAVAMLAVVLLSGFWSIGITDTYALTQSSDFKQVRSNNPNSFQLFKLNGFSGSRVAFYNREYACFLIGFISNSSWDYTYSRLYYQENYNGEPSLYKEDSNNNLSHFEFTYNTTTYYVGYWCMDSPRDMYNYSGNFGCLYSVKDSSYNVQENAQSLISDYIAKRIDPNICTMVSSGENCSTEESTWQGGQDNPIEKADFGYPQIYNSTYIHNDPNNLETLDKLYSGQDFQWKKKTTTGFDLTNNDYNYTYIECKVKANYQYNDKFSGKGSWHDFSSYGEMGNLGKVRAESLSHYYTFQEFQEALPKTSNELPDHKMRAIKSSAVYYFRVVCMKTSSTVVIPDEKDCKYYAGPWRSVTVTKVNGKDGTSVVEDGEFDENGEWKKDDDSGDNGKDIDNGSVEGDDLSDASDKAHETINSNANKSTLDLDSAKAFINQVADVPKMIADIFSFLPDWVKYSFAFGFALIPILIIYKLIRG